LGTRSTLLQQIEHRSPSQRRRHRDAARLRPRLADTVERHRVPAAPRRGQPGCRPRHAFPHRYDHYSAYVHPATDDPAESDKIVRWGRQCWDDLQPFVERAVYVNALEDALEDGQSRAPEAYGPNYGRLVALKKKYDPTNVLTGNQNIKLAT